MVGTDEAIPHLEKEWVLRPAYSPFPTLHASQDFEATVIPVCSIGHRAPDWAAEQFELEGTGHSLTPNSWISAKMLWSQGHSGRGVEKGPRQHPHTCPLPCRPPGHPVQNVLPSTTSMALLSKTCPSAKETCSPLWRSLRYCGP